VVVQWDKDDCADLGIVKVDLLGLGMMSALQDSLTLLRGTGVEVDLATCRRTTRRSTAMLQRPTPWASSRSRAARRWPRCRA
jgi:error-prone DNA polymerase